MSTNGMALIYSYPSLRESAEAIMLGGVIENDINKLFKTVITSEPDVVVS